MSVILGVSLTDFKNVPQYEKIKHPVDVDDDILAVQLSRRHRKKICTLQITQSWTVQK
ncbi:MAG: hypothetical protein H0W19_03180 [Nitrosopumilus sp.]|nr:hypothetical protein [Nitrosopumilus sp.]